MPRAKKKATRSTVKKINLQSEFDHLQEEVIDLRAQLSFASTKAEKELALTRIELSKALNEIDVWKKRFNALNRFTKLMMLTEGEVVAVHEHHKSLRNRKEKLWKEKRWQVIAKETDAKPLDPEIG